MATTPWSASPRSEGLTHTDVCKICREIQRKLASRAKHNAGKRYSSPVLEEWASKFLKSWFENGYYVASETTNCVVAGPFDTREEAINYCLPGQKALSIQRGYARDVMGAVPGNSFWIG